jgi:hypothetical protein
VFIRPRPRCPDVRPPLVILARWSSRDQADLPRLPTPS